MKTTEFGQATLEALCIGFFCTVLLKGILMAFYILYAKHSLAYILDTNNLCLERIRTSKYVCQKQLRIKAQELLFWKEQLQISSQQNEDHNTSSVIFYFFGKKVTWSQTLKKS